MNIQYSILFSSVLREEIVLPALTAARDQEPVVVQSKQKYIIKFERDFVQKNFQVPSAKVPGTFCKRSRYLPKNSGTWCMMNLEKFNLIPKKIKFV